MAIDDVPEGFESVPEKKQKPAGITANYTTNDDNSVSGSVVTDPDSYSTFTAGNSDTGVKNPYNRKVHLPCEFGNPNGAHSEGGKATHLVYLNGGPTADPLETPMAACAHHEVKIREKSAELNPTYKPYFRPIINRRMIAEHRNKVDAANKGLTMSFEARLLSGGLKAENGETTAPVQAGTAEALYGRSTPDFYTRGTTPGNKALEAAKQRRGDAKLYRVKTGKHAGKVLALNPDDVDSGALETTLSRASSPEGAGRAPEGFTQPKKDTSPFRYEFPVKTAKVNVETAGELPIERQGTKKKLAHVAALHKSGVPHAMAMMEAHRLGVHSEFESLLKTHMQDFTTDTDESGTVTIRPGRRPQRSRGTVSLGDQSSRLAEQLPADRVEQDLGTGGLRALSPIEAFTAQKNEKDESEYDVQAMQEQTAARLRAVEAKKQALASRRGRKGLPGLKKELDGGTSQE